MIANKKYILALIFFCFYTIVSGTTYYVSSSGNDAANGLSESTSWKSITKVNSVFSTFMPGDRILFKRGDTFTGTLRITKSGTASNHIQIGTYGSGERPIITGFNTISGWTNYGGGIYSKALTGVSDINTVIIDGVNTAMGRTPDKGTWSTYESSGDGYITDNQLSGSPNWTGADVVIKKEGYIIDRSPITNHSGTAISYSRDDYATKGDATANAGGNGHDGWGYFIQKDINTLTSLGEWYHNGSTFYMYFGAVNPTSKTVKVATIDNGVIFNANYITIDNINFQGFNRTIVDARGGSYISLTNCEAGFAGEYAVFPSNYCTIDNCYLHDTGGSGIYGSMDALKLTNSTLENIGMIDGAWYGWDAMGIGVINSRSNLVIQNNIFRNTGHDGLYLRGDNVLIDKNLFDNCCARSYDQGAIYVTGTGKNSYIISNNVVLNTVGYAGGTHSEGKFPDKWVTAEGIYIDEPASGIIIENNTVANITGGCGIKLHLCHEMIVRNNKIFNCFEGYQFLSEGRDQYSDPIRNVDIYGNEVIAKSPGQFLAVAYSYQNDIADFFNFPSGQQYWARPVNDGVNEDFYVYTPSIGWSNNFKTYNEWKSLTGESNSVLSAIAVSDVNKFRFEYNASKSNKVVVLDAGYLDVTGAKYSGSITLLPYTSVVLMLDPNPSVAPTSPVYVSSAIENATPSILEMIYNSPLASNKVPPASAFSVRVNSVARTINTVTVTGTKVQLTMASPVVSGDVVTVAYTKPASNPLQTPAGGEAANLSAQTVTNKVSSVPVVPVVITPVYVSSAIENTTPSILEITYNNTLANNKVPLTSAFKVLVNSSDRAVNAVTISGVKVSLTLASPVLNGDVVTVAYNPIPPSNTLQTPSGGQAANLSARPVSNKVEPVGKVSSNGPIAVSSSVENSTPYIVEITFNEILGNSTPPSTAFIVLVNGIKRTITKVALSGKKVLLTLADPVSFGDIITVSYIKPASNPLIQASGETAGNFSSPMQVKNNLLKKGNIYVYPNPAREFINISVKEPYSEKQIIRIFDFSGRLCLETILDPFANTIRIPINLNSGVYIVQVILGSLTSFTQKIIVTN